MHLTGNLVRFLTVEFL